MNLPKLSVVDTNVPITANLALDPTISAEKIHCIQNCVKIIEHIIKNGGLVLDEEGEIYEEYRKHLLLKGAPGIGDRFLKWIHNNQWGFPAENRVKITKSCETYLEFPVDPLLNNFDKSDKKFVAVANAHSKHPIIIQATDAKWWKWSFILKRHKILVLFADVNMAKKGCRKKNNCGTIKCEKCDA